MMKKHVLYQENARKALEKGVNILAEAVAITIGPKGLNVVLENKLRSPKIINDGVTIAKEISLQDSVENAGACLLKEAASKTNEIAGDGTTTAIILAHIMIKLGLKNIAVGVNAVALQKGMKKAVNFIIDKIIESAKPVQNDSDLSQIASISAGNDDFIGKIIGEAFSQVGREGIISIEEGQSIKTELEITEGLKFEKGFLSPYFTNDSTQSNIIKNEPYLLLTNQTISLVQKEIIPILELIAKTNTPLVIIAKDVEKKALATLIINKLKGNVDVIAIKAPGFANYITAFLEDISILTNATLITKESGIKFSSLKIGMLGKARKVFVNKDSTTIIGNQNSSVVKKRCESLRKQIEYSDSLYEKEKLKGRLSKLAGGVAVIKVGAVTEVEMQEKKLRFEDAINATRAAIAEGIIAGGGSTLAHLAVNLDIWARESLSEDELIGAQIVQKALTAPLKRIVYNSGNNGATIVDKIQSTSINMGYNAMKNEILDLFETGIVDPAKVTRCALQNAASIAGMFLTTECIVLS